MDAILAKLFLEQGVVGACVIALAIVVWRLYRTQQKTQDSRVSEAQAVADRLIKLSESWVESIRAQTAAVEHQNGEVAELRTECRARTDASSKQIEALVTELRIYNAGKKGTGGGA